MIALKIGLVLEGGAMRGVFSAGVTDVFLEKGFSPDVVIGISAGACLACSFLAKQQGRGFAVMTDYLENKEYCSVSGLLRTGDLFGPDFLYHKIPEELYPIDNQTFMQGNTEFYAGVTNCSSGEAEFFQIKDMIRDVEYIHASSSLPLLANMVEIQGQNYMDGGVSDAIPVLQAQKLGCDKIIVVLTRERNFRKSSEKFLPLARVKYKKFPGLVAALEGRHIMYNNTLNLIAEWESEGNIFVIAPPKPLGIRRAEKDLTVLKRGYEDGRAITEGCFDSLLEYLSK